MLHGTFQMNDVNDTSVLRTKRVHFTCSHKQTLYMWVVQSVSVWVFIFHELCPPKHLLDRKDLLLTHNKSSILSLLYRSLYYTRCFLSFALNTDKRIRNNKAHEKWSLKMTHRIRFVSSQSQDDENKLETAICYVLVAWRKLLIIIALPSADLKLE